MLLVPVPGDDRLERGHCFAAAGSFRCLAGIWVLGVPETVRAEIPGPRKSAPEARLSSRCAACAIGVDGRTGRDVSAPATATAAATAHTVGETWVLMMSLGSNRPYVSRSAL